MFAKVLAGKEARSSDQTACHVRDDVAVQVGHDHHIKLLRPAREGGETRVRSVVGGKCSCVSYLATICMQQLSMIMLFCSM